MAQGARRATLIASVAAVAGLTGGFAFSAANNGATTSIASANKTVATATTKSTSANASGATIAAITTSSGS